MTKAVFSQIQERVQRLQEELGTSAGIDVSQDRYIVGTIAGYKDLLLIDFEEVTNGN